MSKEQNKKFKQTFENKEHNYRLNRAGALELVDSDDAQAKMNSRRVDTLTDMFNKYMNGELSGDFSYNENQSIVFDARYKDLDKVQQAELQVAVQLEINRLQEQARKQELKDAKARKRAEQATQQETQINRQAIEQNELPISDTKGETK